MTTRRDRLAVAVAAVALLVLRMKDSRPGWHCPTFLAPLGSVWGVVDPGAKSRVLGLEALPRSFAPLRA